MKHPMQPTDARWDTWRREAEGYRGVTALKHIACRAYAAGADAELAACVEYLEKLLPQWVSASMTPLYVREFVATRRPPTPTRKQQALAAVERFKSGQDLMGDLDLIREALNTIPD